MGSASDGSEGRNGLRSGRGPDTPLGVRAEMSFKTGRFRPRQGSLRRRLQFGVGLHGQVECAGKFGAVE